jgi:hypothetical protein
MLHHIHTEMSIDEYIEKHVHHENDVSLNHSEWLQITLTLLVYNNRLAFDSILSFIESIHIRFTVSSSLLGVRSAETRTQLAIVCITQ